MKEPMWLKVVSGIVMIFIVCLILLGVSSCRTKDRINALKQLTQSLSEYSDSVDVTMEVGTFGGTITIEANGVDRKWLQSEEFWESE